MAVAPDADGVINLGSGRSRAVSEVIATIESATGRQLVAEAHVADEPFEASGANTGRLAATVGWIPPTTLEAGVERLVAFERAQRREGASVAADR
jgi:nucleoside-diphosphate-sugar epimerase